MKPLCAVGPLNHMSRLLWRAGIVTTLLLLAAGIGAVKVQFFSSMSCSGSPYMSYSYPTDSCNLGGVVYTCGAGNTCLNVRMFASNESFVTSPARNRSSDVHADRKSRVGERVSLAKSLMIMGTGGSAGTTAAEGSHAEESNACSGTPLFNIDDVCDQCIGGEGDYSVEWVDCGSSRPALKYCGDGACSQGCNYIRLPGGCTTANHTNHTNANNMSVALDLQSRSCNTITMTTYQDYNTCSGTVLDVVHYIAGVCQAGMLWTC